MANHCLLFVVVRGMSLHLDLSEHDADFGWRAIKTECYCLRCALYKNDITIIIIIMILVTCCGRRPFHPKHVHLCRNDDHFLWPFLDKREPPSN